MTNPFSQPDGSEQPESQLSVITALPAIDAYANIPDLANLISVAREYERAALAPATRRALRSDWADFESWCREHRIPSLPATPETVALYLADRASVLAASTLARRLTAINRAHKSISGTVSPASTKHTLVGSVFQGIRRTKGIEQKGKDPLLTRDILKLVATCPDTLQGSRDVVIFLCGFAGAFRRSELVAIDIDDLERCKEGLLIHLNRSKTDQVGRGRDVGIAWGSDPETCPVRAVERWLRISGLRDGPLLRSINLRGDISPRRMHPESVALIVKRGALRAGLDPDVLAGHSLRSGFCTQASINNVSDWAIMRQTGHKSIKSLTRYVRVQQAFADNPSGRIGI